MKDFLEKPIFKRLSKLADQHDTEIYVIGGFVRDRIMNRSFNNDIDIVVVGSGIEFAERVSQDTQSKLSVFKNFGTAMLQYNGIDIEFVGARKESYRRQSRKPIVENGTLEDDQK